MNIATQTSLKRKLSEAIIKYGLGIIDREEADQIADKQLINWFEAGKEYPIVYHKGIDWFGQQLAQAIIRDRMDALCQSEDI